ncbi:MAG: FAD-dependent oxidoreductase [Gammaproteobacteria bacterium]|nr:FAD-dependent oxidoreductase [Gammaproteobacteria bacterium]MDH4313442.1 FAD-dependent oxidoreductase [Gammaproteobacteria bacterium]MDH5213018.1 FAD-dependent oxidoreductase [Gammaproteobacteria bacterium]
MNRVLIAGAGHAAGQAAATLRQKKFGGEVILLGEEPYFPYQRPPLSKKFLAGELPAERLYFKPESFYSDSEIEVRLNTKVEQINRGDRSLTLAGGEILSYGRLILATGARVRRLALPGSQLRGIHYLRSITDVKNMREELVAGQRMVVIGAGYIGLEVAAVACQLGLDVSVVEMEDRVMSRVVSKPVSAFYEKEHRRHGVNLLLSTAIGGFAGDDRVSAVNLANGAQLPADIVLIGIGIEPNVELAASAGLEIDNGIVVDDKCRTMDENIYAIGDCTNHPNDIIGRRIRLESVHNALEQAKTAALNICGEESTYHQVPWFWSDQYDIKLQIAGLSQGYDDIVLRGDPDSRSFSCLYLERGRLIAVDAINCPKDFVQAKSLIASHAILNADLLGDAEVALKDIQTQS